jgi:hypothetical protein
MGYAFIVRVDYGTAIQSLIVLGWIRRMVKCSAKSHWRYQFKSGSSTTTKSLCSVGCKVFFVAGATTDTISMIQKMSLFCVSYYRPMQKIATWCRLLMSVDMKKRFSETKKLPKTNTGPSGLDPGPAHRCRWHQGGSSWGRARSPDPRSSLPPSAATCLPRSTEPRCPLSTAACLAEVEVSRATSPN